MATLQLTKENFQEVVENNDTVIVDFWAPWCAPCRAFGPVFEKASENHSDAVFAKINTQEQQELAAAFNIRSIPTLMVFRDRTLVFSQPGMLPGHVLDELVRKVKDLDMQKIRQQIEEESQQASAS
jgi:thioredoxin 1